MTLLSTITHCISAHPFACGGIVVGSIVISVAATLITIIYLPSDYFVSATPMAFVARQSRPVRMVLYVARNLLGTILVLLGAVMSLPGVPGQGVLTILLGVMLLDLPGKRRLERRIVRIGAVRRTIARVRKRFARPPLLLEEPAAPVAR